MMRLYWNDVRRCEITHTHTHIYTLYLHFTYNFIHIDKNSIGTVRDIYDWEKIKCIYLLHMASDHAEVWQVYIKYIVFALVCH